MLKDDVEGTENGRMSFYSLQFFRYVLLSFGWSACLKISSAALQFESAK